MMARNVVLDILKVEEAVAALLVVKGGWPSVDRVPPDISKSVGVPD